MKHSHFPKLLFVALACAAGAAASAATPAATGSLNVVVGGVISPGSCTPASGAISFDMKKVGPASLKNAAETPLAPIVQPLSIKCDGDASVALSVAGTVKAATASDAALDHRGTGIRAEAQKGYIYDLVDAATSTARIGRYVFQFRNFRYTTAAASSAAAKALVVTSNDKTAWTNAADSAANAGQLKADGSSFVTFVDPAAPTVPIAASLFSGDIVVGAVIQPKSELKLNDELTFRGETTITLSYL